MADPLARRVRRAIVWRAGSQVSTLLCRLAVGLLLARLLMPADFGVAAIVLTYAGVFNLFSDFGLGAALVQREQLTEQERSSALWLNLTVACALGGLAFVLAGPFAALFHEPELVHLLHWSALIPPLTALGATQRALRTRDLAFGGMESRVVVAVGVSAVAAIVLALLGAGPGALVGQWIVTPAVSAALLWWRAPWYPTAGFSWSAVRSLGSFGLDVTGTQLLFFLNRNTDNLLIARFLGAGALGVYNIAYQLMLFPLTQIAGTVGDVLFPAFSRLQRDAAALRAAWLRAARSIAAVVSPLMCTLIALAPDAVAIALGPQWTASVPVIQVLAVVGLHQSLQRFNSGILQACDRTRTLLRFSVLSYVVSVAGFVAGLPFGVTGVAIGYAVAAGALAPAYLWMTARVVDLSPWRFAAEVGRPVLAGGVAGAVAALVRAGLVGTGVESHLVLLLVAGSCAVAAYLPSLLLLAPEVRRDLLALPVVRRRMPAREALIAS